MSATVNFARLTELQAKGESLTSVERTEYIKLYGEAQSAIFAAGKHASSVGIKMAAPEQSEAWCNAINILIYNIEGIIRYHANVVCGNQVGILNSLALKLGIPTHASAMEWYYALPTITGSMVAPTNQGIDKGRQRKQAWDKAITTLATAKGWPEVGPVDIAEFVGKATK